MDDSNAVPKELVELESDTGRRIFDDSFVLTATGIAHQVMGKDLGFAILVRPDDQQRAVSQLDLYHRESQGWPIQEPERFTLSLSILSFAGFVALILGFFIFQNLQLDNAAFVDRAASSAAVFSGQWWRMITALFVHADSAHLVGNLFLGAGLAWYLLQVLGPGLTWWGYLISGAVGNFLNAIFYRHSGPHVAIGLSTAVFGAVGVAAGFNFIEALREDRHHRWRKLMAPVGAGLAFLVLWGAAKETDYMAHFWGMGVGVVYGAVISALALPRRLPRGIQVALSIGVLIAIAVAWIPVLRPT